MAWLCLFKSIVWVSWKRHAFGSTKMKAKTKINGENKENPEYFFQQFIYISHTLPHLSPRNSKITNIFSRLTTKETQVLNHKNVRFACAQHLGLNMYTFRVKFWQLIKEWVHVLNRCHLLLSCYWQTGVIYIVYLAKLFHEINVTWRSWPIMKYFHPVPR